MKFKEINDIHALLKKQRQELKKSAWTKAIAQMSQMLAHDIRQPFTMLDGMLSFIVSVESASEVKKISEQYVPQIRAALLSVNSMISDVLEVGSNKAPDMKPTSIESIIQSALNDCFQFDEKSDIRLHYQFSHEHQLNVDGLKILRVFCNIITNAAQAMVFKGCIYFKTNEMPEHMVITIGNTNTYIPPEDLRHLFDPFYTTKKKNGTGLGLAIVQKIIASHSGHIICRSDKIRGTEFEFDLPVAKGIKAPASSQLPTCVSQIRSVSSMLSPASDRENTRMEELEHRILSAQQQIRILVADDEAVYRDMIYEQINKNKIAEIVQLKVVTSAETAIAAAKQFDPDIIIMDVDFGDNGKINGFQAVHEIRRNGNCGVVCIHSNHGALEFQHEAVHVGGNLFLPKPMTLLHLMTIIAESITWHPNTESCLVAASTDRVGNIKNGANNSVNPSKFPLRILVVDDQHVFREVNSRLIQHFLKDKIEYEIITAEGPEESLKIVSENGIDIVFTDLQMNGDKHCGFFLTRKIKACKPNTRVFITSNTIASYIASKALEAGAEGCFQLPLEQANLKTAFYNHV